MPRSLSFGLRRIVPLLAAALLLACRGSDSGKDQAAATPAASGTAAPAGFQYVPIQNDLAVGRNRFVLAILDPRTQAPLPDAQVTFRFFELKGDQGAFRFESDATFRAPAREAGLAQEIPHKHPDGATHNHFNVEADVGVYTSQVAFDKAGQWGVEALVQAKDGRQSTLRAPFEVQATPRAPDVGQPAPASRQPTINDVADISLIDSSAEPDPRLHNLTVADAIARGKPTLVVFATPGYCTSRICGPSVEIVKQLMPAYEGRANFMQIEVYKQFSPLVPSDTFAEWRLQTEPWFFVLDGKGAVAARFEGPTTGAELQAALDRALS